MTEVNTTMRSSCYWSPVVRASVTCVMRQPSLSRQLRASFLRKLPEAMGDRNEDGSVPYCRNHWCHQLQPHCLELGLQDSPFHCHENAFFPTRRQWTTARSLEGCPGTLFSSPASSYKPVSGIRWLSNSGGHLFPSLTYHWGESACHQISRNLHIPWYHISYFDLQSPYFFPFKTLFLTSFHSPNQKLWRICKRPEILSYLQAKRLVCHNCKDPIRRHKTPRSYIKDFIFNGTECSQVS